MFRSSRNTHTRTQTHAHTRTHTHTHTHSHTHTLSLSGPPPTKKTINDTGENPPCSSYETETGCHAHSDRCEFLDGAQRCVSHGHVPPCHIFTKVCCFDQLGGGNACLHNRRYEWRQAQTDRMTGQAYTLACTRTRTRAHTCTHTHTRSRTHAAGGFLLHCTL